ncbi:hypothetical protein C8R45DRAFT_990352 [Mycena sanguinolenta]|nr:hypothetical protein C8R45DRAFT_990352 [Mycena sanguinolenta]
MRAEAGEASVYADGLAGDTDSVALLVLHSCAAVLLRGGGRRSQSGGDESRMLMRTKTRRASVRGQMCGCASSESTEEKIQDQSDTPSRLETILHLPKLHRYPDWLRRALPPSGFSELYAPGPFSDLFLLRSREDLRIFSLHAVRLVPPELSQVANKPGWLGARPPLNGMIDAPGSGSGKWSAGDHVRARSASACGGRPAWVQPRTCRTG